jgi:hypothetical protein
MWIIGKERVARWYLSRVIPDCISGIKGVSVALA